MKLEEDLRIRALRLAGEAREGKTWQEEGIYSIDVAQYVEHERFAVEREHIFRRTPLLVGLSGL